MRILWVYADSSPQELNTSMHRVYLPAQSMAEAGHECRLANISVLLKEKLEPEIEESISWANAIVIERLFIAPVNQHIKVMTGMGKKVFATFDDNYNLMPPEPSYEAKTDSVKPYELWRGGKKAVGGRGSIINEFREGIGLCTGALVPSKLLMEDYRKYQPNMFYVPNFPFKKLWENLPVRRNDVTIAGYGGTNRHGISWRGSSIIPALASLSRKYPKFYTHIQPPFPDVIQQFNKLGVRYSTGNWCSFEDWPKVVATFHVGIACLSGSYDLRRSALKISEYGMAGIPWVATDEAPYKDAVGGILVKNRSADWEKALESLIKDSALRERLGKEGHDWAMALADEVVPTYSKIFGVKEN